MAGERGAGLLDAQGAGDDDRRDLEREDGEVDEHWRSQEKSPGCLTYKMRGRWSSSVQQEKFPGRRSLLQSLLWPPRELQYAERESSQVIAMVVNDGFPQIDKEWEPL
ncbi:hypothetical protein LTR95_011496 [Oleoguttula sp. CCFEE 5521]